jgi:hypothetical protein
MSDKYILRGRVPEPCDDLIRWARWFEKADRHVAKTQVGPLRVSTVFLGVDHSFGDGPPVLFETMIFGDGDPSDPSERAEWHSDYETRCSTWDEAEKMHAVAVREAEAIVAKADASLKATKP